MVRQQDWFNPSVIKKIRSGITLILWMILAVILYVNHGWLITLFTNFFKQL